MGNMHGRLRQARLEAGFRSAHAAAKTYGWQASTYAAHENGQNNYDIDTAEKYGRAFKTRALWLLTGEGAEYEGGDELLTAMKPVTEATVSVLADLYQIPLADADQKRLAGAILEFLATHKHLVAEGRPDMLHLELLRSLLRATYEIRNR